MLIPAAKLAVEKLVDSQGRFVVPVVFVTNAGNCLRQTKADQISHILGVPVSYKTYSVLLIDLVYPDVSANITCSTVRLQKTKSSCPIVP